MPNQHKYESKFYVCHTPTIYNTLCTLTNVLVFSSMEDCFLIIDDYGMDYS